jgi:hypothetical protein
MEPVRGVKDASNQFVWDAMIADIGKASSGIRVKKILCEMLKRCRVLAVQRGQVEDFDVGKFYHARNLAREDGARQVLRCGLVFFGLLNKENLTVFFKFSDCRGDLTHGLFAGFKHNSANL